MFCACLLLSLCFGVDVGFDGRFVLLTWLLWLFVLHGFTLCYFLVLVICGWISDWLFACCDCLIGLGCLLSCC